MQLTGVSFTLTGSEIAKAFTQHAVLPPGASTVLALWVLHTWAVEAALFTPRIVLTSPTKRCGKSTVLDLLRALCRRAVMAANLSTAVLFRVIHAHKPTILIDEADSFIWENEELRGVLNAGYETNGVVMRCVGDTHETARFNCFAAVAIAAIGELPGTIADRSVVIRMARKSTGAKVARRDRQARHAFALFLPRLARWAQDHAAGLADACPALPEALSDRQRDICEPLLAIADLAGGEWPEQGRTAVITLCRSATEDSVDTTERLLADVWELFKGKDFLTLKDIAAKLGRDEIGGWDGFSNGGPLTTSDLARALRRFGLKSRQLRTGDPGRARGFHRDQLAPVVAQYLPPEADATALARDGVTPLLPCASPTVAAAPREASARNGFCHAVTPTGAEARHG